MSILRRRLVIVLMALVSALLLPVGGVVFAEDPPHHIKEGVTPCCWLIGPPDPPCYLCKDTRLSSG